MKKIKIGGLLLGFTVVLCAADGGGTSARNWGDDTSAIEVTEEERLPGVLPSNDPNYVWVRKELVAGLITTESDRNIFLIDLLRKLESAYRTIPNYSMFMRDERMQLLDIIHILSIQVQKKDAKCTDLLAQVASLEAESNSLAVRVDVLDRMNQRLLRNRTLDTVSPAQTVDTEIREDVTDGTAEERELNRNLVSPVEILGHSTRDDE